MDKSANIMYLHLLKVLAINRLEIKLVTVTRKDLGDQNRAVGTCTHAISFTVGRHSDQAGTYFQTQKRSVHNCCKEKYRQKVPICALRQLMRISPLMSSLSGGL
jgi:hypothetical protein